MEIWVGVFVSIVVLAAAITKFATEYIKLKGPFKELPTGGMPHILIPSVRRSLLKKVSADWKTHTLKMVLLHLDRFQADISIQNEVNLIRSIAKEALESPMNPEEPTARCERRSKDLAKIVGLAIRAIKTETNLPYLERIGLESAYAESISYDPSGLQKKQSAQSRFSLFPKKNKLIPEGAEYQDWDEGGTRWNSLAQNRVIGCLTYTKPVSPFSEAYRYLRTQISDLEEEKVFLITSSIPGEGKTISSINLAIAFAQLDKNVLLVDTDLRRSQLHAIFGLSNEVGLVNYLVGQIPLVDGIKRTFLPFLDLLSSGSTPPNPSEQLASKKMPAMVQTLREHYDYIIFDSPAVLAVTDACIIGQLADATLLVSAKNTTQIKLARTLQLLRANKIAVKATIENDIIAKNEPFFKLNDKALHDLYMKEKGNESEQDPSVPTQ